MSTSWKSSVAADLDLPALIAYLEAHQLPERDRVVHLAATLLRSTHQDSREHLASLLPLAPLKPSASRLTNFHLAVITGNDAHFEIAQRAGQDIHAYWTLGDVLQLADKSDQLPMLDKCFEYGFNPDIFGEPRELPSVQSAERVIQNYFERGGKKPTPAKVIALAARAKNIATSKSIISAHLPVRLVHVKKTGFNSFHAAAVSGEAKFLEKADAKGHDPKEALKLNFYLFGNADPLLLALKFGHNEIADALVEREPTLVSNAKTPRVLIQDENLPGLDYLVSKGVRFDGLAGHDFREPPSAAMIDFLIRNGWDINHEDQGRTFAMHIVHRNDIDELPACFERLFENGLRLVSSDSGCAMLHLISAHRRRHKEGRYDESFETLFRLFLASGQIDLDQRYKSDERAWDQKEMTVREAVINRLPSNFLDLAAGESSVEVASISMDVFAPDFLQKYERAKEQGVAVVDVDPFSIVERLIEGSEDPSHEGLWLDLLGETGDEPDLLSLRDDRDLDLLGYYIFLSVFRYETENRAASLSTNVLAWLLELGFSLERKYFDRQVVVYQAMDFGRILSSDNRVGKTAYEIVASADINMAAVIHSEERSGKTGLFSNFVEFLKDRSKDGASQSEAAKRTKQLRSLHGFNPTTVAMLGFGKRVSMTRTLARQQFEDMGLLCIDYQERTKQRLTFVPGQDLSSGDYADVNMSFFVGVEVTHATADCPQKVLAHAARAAREAYEQVPPTLWEAFDAILKGPKTAELEGAFHTQAAGPLASGQLVFGTLHADSASGHDIHRGFDMNQDPQPAAVAGRLVRTIDTSPTRVELDFDQPDGDYFLVASYD